MNTLLKSLGLLAINTLVLSCNGTDQSANKEAMSKKVEPHPMTLTSVKNASQTSSSNNIYTQIAIEACECIQPWLEKAKKLNEFESSKQHLDMKKMASEMEDMQPRIQRCSEAIQNKYSQRSMAIDEKRVEQAIMIQCPDIATIFSSMANLK